MSIRVTADGFSVFVYNHLAGNRPLWHEDVPLSQDNDVQELITQTLTRPRLVDYPLAQVEIVADTPATLLPLEDFRSSDVHALYRLNFPSSTTRIADEHYEIMPAMEAVVIFSLSDEIHQAVLSLYPQAIVRSRQSLLLEEALQTTRMTQSSARQFHAFIGEDNLFVCLFEQGKLRFASAYSAATDADRLYYLLAAWKSLQLSETQDRLLLHDATDTLRQSAARYIKNIQLCE